MKIVFFAIGVESLGVEILSSFLKTHGHQAELIFDPNLYSSESIKSKKLADFFDTHKELAINAISKNPDFIGFSTNTINYQRSLKIAREIKKINPKIPILFGGVHPTSVPELVIKEKCVDVVCVGEGEHALVELFNLYKKNQDFYHIQNLWFKKTKQIIKNPCRLLIKNLDILPLPDKKLFFDIYPDLVRNNYYIITSRGCPFACTYCANNIFHKKFLNLGPFVRRQSPKKVIDELIWAKKNFGIKQISFIDDVFVQDLNWLKTFVRLYKKHINLPYVMETHPKFITYKITKLLADSGCILLAFGVQSASEKTRHKILKRYETNQEIINVAKICHRAKIRFSVDHIFNIPTETEIEQIEALKLYNLIRPSVINSYWLQYFPKTDITEIALKHHVFNKKDVQKINQGLTNTSLVVGFGSKDSFNPVLHWTNFQFLFMLLPMTPPKIFNLYIKYKLYQLPFRPPLLITIGIKFFINLFEKRGYVYIQILRNLFHFSFAIYKDKKFNKHI
jgi:anaerobic magnesium-protoporphyrin IX monomethyl ester cyclase